MFSYSQFIRWVAVPSVSRPGKTDKFPIHPVTGKKHDAHDPTIHMTYQQAAGCTVGDGVGFVFTENDPFFFLDIDNALTDTGWSPLAQQLCQQFAGCFVEVSVSGKGLHIIGSYGTDKLPHSIHANTDDVQLYTSKRFVALTMQSASGSSSHPARNQLIQTINQYFPPTTPADQPPAEWTTKPCDEWHGLDDDAALLDKMLSSRSNPFSNSASIIDLWSGNAQALSQAYPDSRPEGFDRSSADAALCAHLAFWTGKNCERMVRLFNLSGLVRDKWTERDDYRTNTVLKAVAHCKQVYNQRRSEPPADSNPMSGLRTGEQYMSVPAQVEHFKGCVYIRSEDAIFVPDGEILNNSRFRATYGGYNFAIDMNNGKSITSAWDAFTMSQGFHHPKVHEMCFRPEHPSGAILTDEGRTMVNTWVPIVTRRQPGDVTPFLTHIAKLFPDPYDQQIILSYMAAMVQYPGKKFYWCPVVQGVQGNGKTLLISVLSHCVGSRYTHLPNPEDISNKFNSWILGKLLIGVEEAYVADRQEMISVLKILIGNERIDIQGKGANQKTGDNRANFFMCTNHQDSVRLSDADRRFSVFFTAQQKREDLQRDGMQGDYFPNLYRWLRADGYAIINDYLHNYQITDELNPATHAHRAPATSSTQQAVRMSLGVVEQEIMEAVEENKPGFTGGWISSTALDNLLDERKMSVKMPRNKRREMLRQLGYHSHPGLKEGRVNNAIMDCGVMCKPILYVRSGHLSINVVNPVDIVRMYQEAQKNSITWINNSVDRLQS